MKRIISIVALVLVLFAGFSLPVAAHAPNTDLQTLAGQYSVVVETTHLGGNSWIFKYTITNLTEVGDYSDLGGLPEWANGIDHTGLDGFFVQIPLEATISNVQVPEPYIADVGAYWEYFGPHSPNATYNWINLWGQGTQSIYPVGEPLVFSFQVDNVAVGTNEVRLSTFFMDHAMRQWPPADIFYSYTTQITSPVPVTQPEPEPPSAPGITTWGLVTAAVIIAALMTVSVKRRTAAHR